ncbi:MAG: branched-chain amino acid ABC transporter permease [Alphaproteobacteria bacterium]|nr:branched-chain amino acid ABC transporter permease [Alphaproteobacteria bacterium]
MLYRDSGQFKSTYEDDRAIFPIAQDRYAMLALLAVAFVAVPILGNDYWLRSIFTPFLIYSLAAIGLNILTGYAGQVSLGAGGFMAVGAFSVYNLLVRVPEINFILALVFGGLVAAAVGALFGIPSLRIKGLYLMVATLAAQFFIEWSFTKFPWFTNYAPSGVISATPIDMFGWKVEESWERYVLALAVVTAMALVAKNLVRGSIGRSWMAIRDMDVAAEIIGIQPMQTKLLAFAVSSFYCGVAGALWAYLYLGTVEPVAFGINTSFQILFMIIIGGLGSILGSFLGAGFIILLPIFINIAGTGLGLNLSTAFISHMEFIIFGSLIILFLIVEPHGLARLWQIAKEKLRLWPFPY